MKPSPLGSYESQVKIFLTLLALFLAVAIYFNFHLLVVARGAIQQEVGRRLALHVDLVRAELERDQMLRGLRAGPGAVPYIPPTLLDRMARQRGMARIEILNLDGRVLSSSDPGRVGLQDEPLEEEGGGRRARLLAGGSLVIPVGDRPGSSARLAAYRPLQDQSFVTTAILKIEEEVAVLASVDLNLKLISALQGAGLVFVLVLVVLFARWLLQPYRRLARAAGQAPGTIAGLSSPGSADDPDDMVRAFQGVLDTLRRQEGELLALKQGRASSLDAMPLPGDHLIRGMTSGVLVFDRDGRLRVLNEAAERLLGLARDTAVGRAYADLLGENRRLADLIERCLTTGESRSREVVPLAGPSGRMSHLGAMISPIRGGAGQGEAIEGALCLLADLTEIKSLREKVALKENLAALGEMSAGIAHEFRNALAAIQGLARLIARPGRNGDGAPGPGAENAEAILREVGGIAKVVDDFLRFARPASLVLSEVDPKGLAEELVEDLRDDPLCRGIRLEVRGAGPRIVADEALLRQALQNLLRNAAEALAAPGGSEPPRISGEARRIVVIVAPDEAAPGGARITVEDNGDGIPSADLPRIFAPFFTTKDRGTGLGLALVQKTAVVHDGRVEVESRPGEATRFTLVLPARPGAPGTATPI